MRLSCSVMVVNVPVYFGFDAVERVSDNAVVVVLFFLAALNECHKKGEAASNNSNQYFSTHVITNLELC